MAYLAANIAVVLFAWRITPFIAPVGGPWLRAMTTLFVGIGAVLGLTLFTGVLGLLTPVALTLGAWGLVLVGELSIRGRTATEREALPWTATVASIVPVGMLGGSLGLWFANAGWRGTDFVFDDITYHAAVPVQWFMDGAIGYAPLTYQSYYPFNAELLGLWSLVLQGHLGNSGTGVLAAVVLAFLGGMAFAENLEVRPAPVLALWAAMLAAPRMVHFSQTFSGNDLVVTAFTLCALAFATARSTRRAAVWCGLALGAAVGAKVSVAGAGIFIGLWWVWRGRRDPVLPVLLVAASLVFGGWWYAHNLFATGNPLYPAQLGPFDGPLDKAAQYRTSLLWFVEQESARPDWWRNLIHDRLNWPVVLGSGALSGYIVAFGAGLDRRRRGAWLALAVGLTFLALHPLQPYSGTVNRPHGRLHSMVRYLTLPTVLGLPLLAFGSRRRDYTEAAVAVLGGVGWLWMLYQWDDLSTLQLGCMALGVALALGVAVVPRLPMGTRLLWLPLLLLVVFAWRGEAKRVFTMERSVDFSPAAKVHRAGWITLDGLADGRRVGWLSDLPSSHTFALPLVGQRFQHTLVPLDRHGRHLDRPLHERPALDNWWTPFKVLPKADQPVLDGLVSADVDTLYITRCQHSRGGRWPRPRDLLRNSDAVRVHHDACVEVYDLRPLLPASDERSAP